MQPPRSRTPRIDLSDTETLRALILNATAIAMTLLTLRVATLVVTDSSDGTFPRYLQMVTEPLVWPFKFLPILSATILANITLIDILMIPVIAMAGLFVAGILTGWRESGARARRYPSLRE